MLYIALNSYADDFTYSVKNPLPHGNSTYGLDFYDVNIGVMSCYGGTMFLTEDGCNTWKLIDLPANQTIHDICMPTEDIIVGVGNNGIGAA